MLAPSWPTIPLNRRQAIDHCLALDPQEPQLLRYNNRGGTSHLYTAYEYTRLRVLPASGLLILFGKQTLMVRDVEKKKGGGGSDPPRSEWRGKADASLASRTQATSTEGLGRIHSNRKEKMLECELNHESIKGWSNPIIHWVSCPLNLNSAAQISHEQPIPLKTVHQTAPCVSKRKNFKFNSAATNLALAPVSVLSHAT